MGDLSKIVFLLIGALVVFLLFKFVLPIVLALINYIISWVVLIAGFFGFIVFLCCLIMLAFTLGIFFINKFF